MAGSTNLRLERERLLGSRPSAGSCGTPFSVRGPAVHPIGTLSMATDTLLRVGIRGDRAGFVGAEMGRQDSIAFAGMNQQPKGTTSAGIGNGGRTS